jgi:inorganic pyrophosphatase
MATARKLQRFSRQGVHVAGARVAGNSYLYLMLCSVNSLDSSRRNPLLYLQNLRNRTLSKADHANPMPSSLIDLDAYADDDALQVIVECPRGSRLKLDYEPDLRLFSVSRPLPIGMCYPYDWGFIPGTRAADGDPVDALLLSDVATYPGVLIKGRAIGMVVLTQAAEPKKSGKPREREINNRVIVLPTWRDARQAVTESLPQDIRDQLEEFFVAVTRFTDKRVEVKGWASARAADAYVKAHRRRRSRR